MAPQVTITAVDAFTGKLAVVTGGGSGIGRGLVRQLAAQGCSVAACDLDPDSVAVTAATAWAAAPPGVAVTAHRCDVCDESQVQRFRDELLAEHATDHVDLVFSNAGSGGGGGFFYYCAHAFLPLLIASGDGVLVTTGSLTGLRAPLGPGMPNNATDILAGTRRAHGLPEPEDMSDEQAATIILDGVRSGASRILVGRDVAVVGERVRSLLYTRRIH
jgi:NAD(P)-dependent dehydrogenase (short-subunit alcohol dehydrogenase family)